MSSPIIEIATIRLRRGVSEAALVEASEKFQEYLDGVAGFMRRELLRQSDGEYADLVHWRSQADAEAMMAAAASTPECLAYFSLMDIEGMDPTHGVQHFASLAVYDRT